ncbi:flagellar hook assembly protein FlgD [Clostridium sp. ZS2-4]|uniref:flagellar hook assembly protein FlgD n=1 Tax=Clostridium sp. ZS2-4 TaxID=2987703 RepID=UPI00227A330C|nr:flagellar hook capping FlgD N-terminal domain-containing protein [Clostridium sp. ZS2-4]MCY6354006.1 flagellar biosynthesis protein FlgD [Clostridium sp. ZS2-4]
MPESVNKSVQSGFQVDNSNSTSATKRGTRIVKKGHEMDKNAFLRILTAELTNQDPMNTKDSTAYVSQLAQFSSLEQMANLNNTMSFNAAGSLVGRTVALNVYDDWGHQYGGIVKNVAKNGDEIKLTVNVPKYIGDKVTDFEDKEFDLKDMSEVLNIPTEDTKFLGYLSDNMTYLNNNMNFMVASSMINKNVDLSTMDGEEEKKYSGIVTEVYKAKEGIKLKVKLDGSDEEKEFFFDNVTKVKQ